MVTVYPIFIYEQVIKRIILIQIIPMPISNSNRNDVHVVSDRDFLPISKSDESVNTSMGKIAKITFVKHAMKDRVRATRFFDGFDSDDAFPWKTRGYCYRRFREQRRKVENTNANCSAKFPSK